MSIHIKLHLVYITVLFSMQTKWISSCLTLSIRFNPIYIHHTLQMIDCCWVLTLHGQCCWRPGPSAYTVGSWAIVSSCISPSQGADGQWGLADSTPWDPWCHQTIDIGRETIDVLLPDNQGCRGVGTDDGAYQGDSPPSDARVPRWTNLDSG